MPKVNTRKTSEGHFFIKNSTPFFDTYSLNTQKSVLLITAHGNTQLGDEEPLYQNTGHLGEPVSAARPRGIVEDWGANRPSVMFPAARHFSPKVPVTFFNEHGTILKSEKDSTMRRILQVRAIGCETYPPGRSQSDYDLYDVSKRSKSFAGTMMPRKDFIKAIMLEALFLRESTDALKTIMDLNIQYPHKIVSMVPDILMVTGKTTLNDVLRHPDNQNYLTVFCEFCRPVYDHTVPVARTAARAPEIAGILDSRHADIESRVLRNLQEIGR
jgi:hypothetical protein